MKSMNLLWVLLAAALGVLLTGCPLFRGETKGYADTTPDGGNDADTDGDGDSDTWPFDTEVVDTDPMNLPVEVVATYPGDNHINGIACWDDKIAWQHLDKDGWSIRTWDASTAAIDSVDAHGAMNVGVVVMSSEVVAWSSSVDYEQPDLWFMSIDSGTPVVHGKTDTAEWQPRIHGNRVIYSHIEETGENAFLGSLGGSDDRTLNSATSASSYDIWEDTIAYLDRKTGDIFVENLNTGSITNLGTGDGDRGNINDLRVSGDHVVYYRVTGFGDNSIPAIGNITTGVHRNIAYNIPGVPLGLEIDGNYAAYVGADMNTGYTTTSVHIYDIEAGVLRQGTEHLGAAVWDFGMGGGRMCWIEGPLPGDSSVPWEIRTALLP